MRIEIEIPKEFECDYNADKFNDFFSRVLCDIKDGELCGNYEMETAEMLLKAFEESKEAYDEEAVVAKLKENSLTKFDWNEAIDLEEAIEIVRNSGKE